MNEKDRKKVFEYFGIVESLDKEYEVLTGKTQLQNCLEHLPERLESKKSSHFKMSLYFDPAVACSVLEIEAATLEKHEKSIVTEKEIALIRDDICSEKSSNAILDHFKLKRDGNNIYTIARDSEKAIYVLRYLGSKVSLDMKEKSRFTFHYDPDIPFTVGIVESFILNQTCDIGASASSGNIE